jgi:hypothetical protein
MAAATAASQHVESGQRLYGCSVRRKWTPALLAACALSLAASGCSSPWLVGGVSSPIRLLVSHPCPVTLGATDGVSNPGISDELVAPNPTSGLICRYAPPSPFNEDWDLDPGSLYDQVWLTPSQAVHLAAVIGTISTAAPTGTTACPADFDSTSLIVFAYAGAPDIDLWFHDTGCQTLDNGKVKAFEPGNPNFYGPFDSLIQQWAPSRT